MDLSKMAHELVYFQFFLYSRLVLPFELRSASFSLFAPPFSHATRIQVLQGFVFRFRSISIVFKLQLLLEFLNQISTSFDVLLHTSFFIVLDHISLSKFKETKIVLSKPLTLESQSDSDANHEAPNILQRILSLFKNIRQGSDLSSFKLPPMFNMPKSQLQCYAESVYCTATGSDLLSNLNSGQTPHDRLISVVAWSISTTRPLRFGVAPYNSTLGETHHVSKGNLNVLLEQVSHHPPVSALHATDDKENIEMTWCHFPVSKFNGTSVETKVHGKRQLKLHNHGETYEMNSPNLVIKILPIPGTDWVGNVSIRCLETGLVAELNYISQSFFGFGAGRRLVKGKIFDSLSMKILYKIEGHWDSIVTVKNTTNAEVRVIYDAKKVISGLQAPIVKDPESMWPTETALVWGGLSQAIMSKDWEKAREAKKIVEETQRELQRERESKGQNWVPKHFMVSYNKEEGWNCSPIEKWVPDAPIVTL